MLQIPTLLSANYHAHLGVLFLAVTDWIPANNLPE